MGVRKRVKVSEMVVVMMSDFMRIIFLDDC